MLIASSSSTAALAAPKVATLETTDTVLVTLVSGDYGDYDADAEQDDIRLVVAFDFTACREKEVRITLNIQVIMPSGDSYTVLVEIWTNSVGIKVLEIIVFDGAWESGWYETILTGVLRGLNGTVYLDSYLIFDPPTEKGVGSPTATATWLPSA